MSQEQLADLLGVTFQQVQKYEKGVNRIAASRLFDIASSLEVPMTYFFDDLQSAGKKSGGARRAPHDALALPGAAQLLSLYASIKSAAVRRRVIDLVRALEPGD